MIEIKKIIEHIKIGSKPVYVVITDYGDREVTLGYATGDLEDIKQFYKDKMGYSLSVKPVVIEAVDINKETLEKKLTYLRLKKELKDLESELR